MDSRVKSFFDEIKGKRAALVGVGVSHRRLAGILAEKGAKVTVLDRREKDALKDAYEELSGKGVAFRLGERYLENLTDFDFILRTPGMKYHLPELEEARRKGVAVTSEMELFFDLCPAPVIAVTGSDGKTTTTSVIAEMLRAEGKTVHLGGNIGRALLPEIEKIRPEDFAVVELSSFQLISMRKSPKVAVVTNVAPNHLDMHKDMQEYIDAKKNIFLHQNAFSRTVLNLDNDITAAFSEEVRGQAVFFSRKQAPENGAYLNAQGIICYNENGRTSEIMPQETIRIPGTHNVENYLAAISAVWGYVFSETIIKVAREFGGVEHRIEFVRELDGVKYYNDSIATSPTRTIAGLRSFRQKMIIIAGGYDKHIPFEPLVPVLLERVKVLVLTGDTAQKIEETIRKSPDYTPEALTILHAETMEEAVQKARESAGGGDVVSLSPACASFDRYPNFEARGRHYKEIVNSLS